MIRDRGELHRGSGDGGGYGPSSPPIRWVKAPCPTCHAPAEFRWLCLDLVAATGDETLASRRYRELAPTRVDMIGAIQAATLALRASVADSDESGHAALELCERVLAFL